MRDSTAYQTVLQSPVGLHYLGVSSHPSQRQPLCRNAEGWGPISPFRYDFTPCFLDVWIASVSVFGLIFGAGAVYYLLKKCSPQPVKQDWHFYTKLSVLAA
ncbi:hypothetical protein KCU59_g22328, partial [Aureobasidium melanogenum]